MPDKYPYYWIKYHHKTIFKKAEPCSFFELLFAVEAPSFITGVDIWKYCTHINIENINFEVDKISDNELSVPRAYPFYDLFRDIWEGVIRCPLIFQEDKKNNLVCIEGRHRLRLLILFYQENSDKFIEKIGTIPAVVVYRDDDKSSKNLPPRYDEWEKWLSSHNVITNSVKMKETYAKFLLGK